MNQGDNMELWTVISGIFVPSGDYTCPVSLTESGVETHALGGIGLAVLAQEMPVSLSPTLSPKLGQTELDQKNALVQFRRDFPT